MESLIKGETVGEIVRLYIEIIYDDVVAKQYISDWIVFANKTAKNPTDTEKNILKTVCFLTRKHKKASFIKNKTKELLNLN